MIGFGTCRAEPQTRDLLARAKLDRERRSSLCVPGPTLLFGSGLCRPEAQRSGQVRFPGEVVNLLRDAVFEQRKVVLRQVLYNLAIFVVNRGQNRNNVELRRNRERKIKISEAIPKHARKRREYMTQFPLLSDLNLGADQRLTESA